MDFVNSSEVDIAYYVLTEKGETMYYKDLVLEVIEKNISRCSLCLQPSQKYIP